MTDQNLLFIRRAVAYSIDALLSTGVMTLGLIGLGIGVAISPDPDHLTTPAVFIVATSVFGFSFLGFGYFLFRDGIGGAGIGKRIAGIRVVLFDDGRPCGFLRSAARQIPVLALGMFDLILPLFLEGGRRLGDQLAGTVVRRKE